MNSALSHILRWFDINNLMLNAKKKTKMLEFALPNVKEHNFSIVIKGKTPNMTKSAIFLGITINSKLQWNVHLEAIANKLGTAAFAIKKIR